MRRHRCHDIHIEDQGFHSWNLHHQRLKTVHCLRDAFLPCRRHLRNSHQHFHYLSPPFSYLSLAISH
ncbi:unnamed protein product [Rodentolepis nana]|uniref:Uncharacterized protein n=1 Tax=Rodentolepis nana TaxID=102285 RepID=A0A3P7V674_RODNA|nr:unnamed protein product [Rodentolepis nana]